MGETGQHSAEELQKSRDDAELNLLRKLAEAANDYVYNYDNRMHNITEWAEIIGALRKALAEYYLWKSVY